LSMHIQIGKTYHLSASHQLKALPPEHPCSRLHGHNYEITIVVKGKINRFGFVIDYRLIDTIFGDRLMAAWDHRHLNDVLGSEDGVATTAELLVAHLCDQASRWFASDAPEVKIHSITVRETAKTFASVTFP